MWMVRNSNASCHQTLYHQTVVCILSSRHHNVPLQATAQHNPRFTRISPSKQDIVSSLCFDTARNTTLSSNQPFSKTDTEAQLDTRIMLNHKTKDSAQRCRYAATCAAIRSMSFLKMMRTQKPLYNVN